MRRQGVRWVGVLAIVVALLPGCALTTHFAYTNTELTAGSPPMPQASFEIRKRPGVKQHENVLVLLALSGGGSRAAYFSARAMLALEKVRARQGPPLNVLKEVDLISSVSGGSLAAAYYASSVDPGAPEAAQGRRAWDEETVTDLMGRDYPTRSSTRRSAAGSTARATRQPPSPSVRSSRSLRRISSRSSTRTSRTTSWPAG